MSIDFKKLLFFLFGLTLFPGLLLAGDAGRESQFSLGSGVRAVGAGGGFVGMGDDASAVYWNQAALGWLDNQEIGLMHVTLFEGSMYDVINYVYPSARLGGFGLSFMRLGTDDIIRREDWLESGEFGYYMAQFIMAYGRRIRNAFYLGGAIKVVNQSLDNNSAYGVGFDLSFFKPVNNHISIGLMIQDIIPSRLRLSDKTESGHNIIRCRFRVI